MSASSEVRDERLVDLLDDALRRLRSGERIDPSCWRSEHPEFGEEAASLLSTLVELSAATDDWRTASQAMAEAGRDVDEELPDAIGRYRILRQIGAGAMGRVYQARDPQLDRIVAIKVPQSRRLDPNDPEFRQRFLREARAAAAVRHPHVCPVYDAAEEDGRMYVVMAFVEGETLEQRLQRGRFEDPRDAVRIALEVAAALEAVHQHGIIHRDLKPGNVLLDRAGRTSVTDFGLAREITSAQRLTCDGLLVGTPAYMSPEQAAGADAQIGPPSDQYSLATVLYETLTGVLPFQGSLVDVLHGIIHEPPRSPHEHRLDLDPKLSSIILRALAKRPEDRFADMQSFAHALQRWAEPTRQIAVDLESKPRGRWRRNGRLLVFGGVAAVALFATATILLRGPANELRGLVSVASSAASDGSTEGALPRVPLPVSDSMNAEVLRSTAPEPLRAELVVRIASEPDGIKLQKDWLRVEEPGALPLRNGEWVHIAAEGVNRPAHVYLLWIDADGNITPLYPWDAGQSSELWDAPFIPGGDQPVTEAHCPADDPRSGLPATGSPGWQTVLLLASETALDEPNELRALLSDLPHRPPAEATLLKAKFRGVEVGSAGSIDDPMISSLHRQLRPRFEIVRVLQFMQAGPVSE